jgi:hypothetical protein
LFTYIFKTVLIIPVAPVITLMTKHFMSHIRWISILRCLYSTFFSAFFRNTFLSHGIAASINKQVPSFLFLTIMPRLFARTSLSVYTPWFHNTFIFMFSYVIIIIIINSM